MIGTALEMPEQTCFLHVLCPSELETNIRIRPSDESVA